jgi:acyl transferase domain-containing protein/acyl carrier protein
MPIAIVGAGCRLPGAPGLDALWPMLEAGTDAVTTLPADRFPLDLFLHPRRGEPGRSHTFAAGTIGDARGFDAGAFGISPREAAEMDPQQRVLLEVTAEALEDAGWRPSAVAGRGLGVFIGGSATDYAELRLPDYAGSDRYFMTGNALSILSNRLTNVFDLRGPAQTIDTACSSSLVALHAACAAIAEGRIEGALVGGVQMLLSPFAFIGFSRAGMLSPSGRCRAFDAAADGYVRGEGAVALLLKPLDAALAAGDAVRGVILGTGVNSAGRTIGLSLPNREAQATLIRRVMAEAGVTAEDLAYFEAHGTGTQAGDPTEAWAIGQAATGRSRPLPIGSIKTNIGHLEPASGLAGLLKAMLVLERGRIPPTLHQARPNPNIDFPALNIRVGSEGEALDRAAPGAVAGVNSFGFGGTNATVLLGPAPARPATEGAARPGAGPGAMPPLLLSARSAAALSALAGRWEDRLRGADAATAAALARGAARHRDLSPHRLVLRGRDGDALAAAIAAWRQPAPRPDTAAPAGTATAGTASAAPASSGGIGFVFSGNGAQHAGMARAALAHSPAFRRAFRPVDAAMAPLLGWSPLAKLRGGVTAAELAATDVAQPLLFAIQVASLGALAAQGIRPGIVLGHSVGEVAAAHAAGILDLPAAARLVVARSRHQQRMRGVGRMAALGASAADAAAMIAELGPAGAGLEIAARNAPAAVTLAGPAEALAALQKLAEARRHSFIPLDLDFAFHSSAMDPVRDGLLADLAALSPGAARLPLVSTVTGQVLDGTTAGALYWWRNLRQPVLFDAALRAALEAGARLFVEIGPHPVLQSYMRETFRAAGADAAPFATLSRRDAEAQDPFPGIADRLVAGGADPRDGPAFRGAAIRRLPLTPFDRRPAWHPATPESTRLLDPERDHPLLGFRQGSEPGTWSRLLDTELEPWLADHRLGPDAVLPASGMLDMALAAARCRHPEAAALEVAEFRILRPLALEAGRTREVRSTLDAAGAFRLESRRRLSGEGWALHAQGEAHPVSAAALSLPPRQPLPGATVIEGPAIRARAASLGLTYGPAFAAVERVEALGGRAGEPDRALVRLALPDAAPPDAAFLLHPSRLDGALQGLFGMLSEAALPPGIGIAPVRFARLVTRPGAVPPVLAEVSLLRRGARSVTASAVLRDAAGHAVARIDGAVFQMFTQAGALPAADAAWRIALAPAAEGAPPTPALAPALEAARSAAAAMDQTEAALLLEAHVAAAAQALYATMPAHADAAPEASPYNAFLRRALIEDGAAEPLARGGIRLLPDSALPPAEAIWRSVLAEQPGLALDLAWIAEAAERLPEALRGQRRDPAPPPAEGLAMARLADALAAAVGALAAAWPETRPIRILEVGAAGGVLARRVLARIAPLGRALVYVAAGEGHVALPALPPGLPAGSSLAGAVWNPLSDAPAPLVADLVIGLAPAARARAGVAMASALRRALAEGGTLLVAEPLPGRVWTFVCGQDPAWWSGLGPDPAGSAGGSLPDATLWTGRLADAGFRAVAAEALGCAPWPALLLAGEAPPPPAAAPPAPPRTLLLADAASLPLADALAARLLRRGGSVARAALDAAIDPATLRGARLLLCASPDAAGLPGTLAAITRLAEAAQGQASGFILATSGGQQPAEGRHQPEAAALLGLMRVLANEMPALRPRRIDVAPGMAPAAAARRLAAELDSPAPEAEVTLGPDQRLVPRLQPVPAAPPAGPLALGIGQPGRLGTLRWEAAPERAPGAGEVAIAVEAAGLNFRDLMWAQGLLPEEVLEAGFAGPTLGMECAGVVTAAGPGVAIRPGTRVFGFAPAALAARVVTRVEAIAPLPDGLSAEEAATIPVAFLTALHALESCAGLQAGETVLIHGGAGGVGLAALQVAQLAGARVAMTAGSPAKRAFLRAAGAELVLDSRDPGFADALRAAWPEGVDVVLNSLAGEAMERSLGLLKPFGRFVELGKRDYIENRRAPIRPLRRNASYFAVDVDELPRARPGVAARLLAQVRDRLQDGSFLPLPHAAFGPEEVEAAFRTLQASAHIGKLVIRPPAPAGEDAAEWAPPAEATIVVVGGTRGFGLATAKWLAARGARHLALISRRGAVAADGPGEEATALRDLAALGARAAIHACDAADAEALAATLTKIRAGRPIGGVVHAAAVLDDGAATAMDAGRFQRVLAPKLAAAENLDRLTAGDPISLFLLFSSATTAFGNPGQSNYVAANAGLEALARRRRAAGRPALAVAWGPIHDVGMLAADGDKAATLNRRLGVAAMTAAESLALLPALLAAGDAAPMVVRLGAAEGRLALPIMREAMLAVLAGPATAAPARDDLRAHLASLPRPEAEALVLRLVTEEIARILRLPPEGVGADAAVTALGLDSLGAMELRGGLEQRLGVQVALSALSEELTVGTLARQIAATAIAQPDTEATISTLMEAFEPAAGDIRAAE